METIFRLLGEQPLLFLFIVVGIGTAIGRISVKSIALGAAAVLFTSIALTAWATTYGVKLEISDFVGNLSVAVFAFAVGIIAGPNFFATLKTSYKFMIVTAVVLIVGAGVGLGVGTAMHVPPQTIAGAFAGALNNTPALAAAGGSPAATVGYASAYVFGVIGALVATSLALAGRKHDTDQPQTIIDATIRVDADHPETLAELREHHGGSLQFTRMRSFTPSPEVVPTDDTQVERGDLLTVVGPDTDVAALAEALGHISGVDLKADRQDIDFRRITLSEPKLAAHTVAELDLRGKFQGHVVRVRRGDVELVATPDLPLQLGDRLRVVAPADELDAIGHYLGDSTRGMSDINPAALGLGLVIGIAIGIVPIPLPGGTSITIGLAAGTLIMGLVMGRVGRIGNINVSLPFTSATVLSEFGLLIFLAYAGSKAGSLIIQAFAAGQVWTLILLGAIITTVVLSGMYIVMKYGMKLGGTRLSGVMGGQQTNPAILGYANSRTGYDQRVALGYALVYPTAMIVKILLAQIIAGM